MRRYMGKPPGGALDLPGLPAAIAFAKVSAFEAVLDLAKTGLASAGDVARELTL